MYYKTSVRIPVVKGKIIIKNKGDAKYVMYQYGQKYNTEKKYAVPQRTIIGKVSDSDPLSMFPNEKFNEYFPEIAINEELKDPYRSSVLKIGTYVVIRKIFTQYGLDMLLEKRFGKDAGLLMDIVAHLIIDEENKGISYTDYAFTHPLFSDEMVIYSEKYIKQFLSEVVIDEINEFIDEWNRYRDHDQCVYIAYDSLDLNRKAGDLDFFDDNENRNSEPEVFSLAMAFDKTNQIPLFYETYAGAIDETAQFRFMVDKVKEAGYEKVGFILDRGSFSMRNIQDLEKNGYSFLMVMNGQKPLIRKLIDQYRNSFESEPDSFIRKHHIYGTTVSAPLFNEHDRKYYHLYFDASRQAFERERLECLIEQMGYFLHQHINEKIRFNDLYHEFFELKYDDRKIFIGYHEKKENIKTVLKSCGYFCIITSEDMSASKALNHYYARDISEKLFKTDQFLLNSGQMKYSTSAYLSVKLFIGFLALIVRNSIYNRLKEEVGKLKTRPNFMSVSTAIRELEKIELVKRNNGQYRMDRVVSTKQKIILNAFDITTDDIMNYAGNISDYLITHRHSEDDNYSDNGLEEKFDNLL